MPTAVFITAPTRHNRLLPYALLCACIAFGLLFAPTDAHARRKKSTATTASTAKNKPTKVKYIRSSSEESSTERDRRLYRECRGQTNAGACLGYTRK